MVVTTKRKKLEILVDMPLLRRIRLIAEEIDITGYTLYPTIGGDGNQGRWQDDQVTGGAGSKVMFSTIVDEQTAGALLNELTPLLDTYGIIVTISNVEVIRGERF